MAETQVASTGYNGEVHLSTDGTALNLDELVQVVSFSLPSDTAERVETTHLKSPGRRREYTGTAVRLVRLFIQVNGVLAGWKPGDTVDACGVRHHELLAL